jgi:DNA-directed RNA polymerase specialized sigma subunit
MSEETNLRLMTVEELALRCTWETDLYFNRKENDTQYCFELFRRAIREQNEHALQAVILQYQPMVTKWVAKWMEKFSEFESGSEEPQDYVAQAFERFWISFTPEKFDKSQGLPAILRYLQMCVHGAVTDTWRKLRRAQFEHDIEADEQRSPEADSLPEEFIQKDEFWQLIRKKARNAKEYTVVYASFSLSLSPREILAEYPDEFENITEIYQYKANLLDRLERDEDIRKLASRDG